VDDDQPWVNASLNPFRNKLARTAILVTVLSTALLIMVSWRSPGEGSWRLGTTSYTVLTTLLSTIISIGVLSLIWEYFLRASYARSLHHYLSLKSSLVATGLSHRAEICEQRQLVAEACARLKREKHAPLLPSVLLGVSYGGFSGGLGNNFKAPADRPDADAIA